MLGWSCLCADKASHSGFHWLWRLGFHRNHPGEMFSALWDMGQGGWASWIQAAQGGKGRQGCGGVLASWGASQNTSASSSIWPDWLFWILGLS